MALILGLLLVAAGFLITGYDKRTKKENKNLRIGIIKNIEKEDELYKMDVEYSPDGNEKTTEVPIYVKKKPNKTEIILVDNNGDISIFKENISLALTACGCWIVGAILCMFA